jgi:hypothetical protein
MTEQRHIPRAVCALDRGLCWCEEWFGTLIGVFLVVLWLGLVVFVSLGFASAVFYPLVPFPVPGVELTPPTLIDIAFTGALALLVDGLTLVVGGWLILTGLYGDDWRVRCHRARMRGRVE